MTVLFIDDKDMGDSIQTVTVSWWQSKEMKQKTSSLLSNCWQRCSAWINIISSMFVWFSQLDIFCRNFHNSREVLLEIDNTIPEIVTSFSVPLIWFYSWKQMIIKKLVEWLQTDSTFLCLEKNTRLYIYAVTTTNGLGLGKVSLIWTLMTASQLYVSEYL